MILLLSACLSLLCHFCRFLLLIVTYIEFGPNVRSIKTILNKAPSSTSMMNLFAKHCKVIWSHAEFKFSSQTAPKLFFAISEQIVIKRRNIFEYFFSVFLTLRNSSNRKNWQYSNTWSGKPSGEMIIDGLFFAEFAGSCLNCVISLRHRKIKIEFWWFLKIPRVHHD